MIFTGYYCETNAEIIIENSSCQSNQFGKKKEEEMFIILDRVSFLTQIDPMHSKPATTIYDKKN